MRFPYNLAIVLLAVSFIISILTMLFTDKKSKIYNIEVKAMTWSFIFLVIAIIITIIQQI